MTDFPRTARPTGGQDLDVLLGPLAAYLHALEARVGALERRVSAVPLMTATDAARHTRLNVETILRAVRAGELAVAHLSRCPRRLACQEIIPGGTGFSAAPPPSGASDAVEAEWQALG